MRVADYLTTFMCRMSWKTGSLNLLEPPRPHRARYGAPLPLLLCFVKKFVPTYKTIRCQNEDIPVIVWMTLLLIKDKQWN